MLDSTAMKVLVLGDSDSAGTFNGGITWTKLVEASLSDGEPVSVRSVAFSAVPAGAAAFAERKVRELSPDVVILLVGGFGFTFGFVELRIQRLFGKRAAAWSKRVESGFDARTRRPAEAPNRLNKFGRGLVRRVIGTEPLTTREQLTTNFREVFQALARLEDTDVIALTYPGIGHHAHRRHARVERRRFFADLKRSAETHHFVWVSTEGMFDDLPDWHSYAVDELHFNQLGHERIAELALDALRRMVPRMRHEVVGK